MRNQVIYQIAPDIFFFISFSTRTYVVGTPLEVPRWGTSNEYPQHIFAEK